MTRVRVETHYDRRGLVGRLMSALMIKRKFRQIRGTALANLKRLAEAESLDSAQGPLGTSFAPRSRIVVRAPESR